MRTLFFLHSKHILNIALCVGVIALFAGCGPSGLKTVDVSGKITYGGGPWPKPGKLTFPCIEPAEGFPNRPGSAEFDVDGNFVASSYGQGDGLHPGKYSVHVECWEVPPSMDATVQAKSYVPENFAPTFEIKPSDREVTLQWDAPVE